MIRERQDRELQAHESACLRCWTYARTCRVCGVDISRERHRFLCRHNEHRWRELFRGVFSRDDARDTHAARNPPHPAHAASGASAYRPRPYQDADKPDPRARPRASRTTAPRTPPKTREVPLYAERSEAKPKRAKKPKTIADFEPVKPKPPARPPAPLPHEVLQIGKDADPRQVLAAYRELALQYHPDRVQHLAPEFREVAERRMSEINAAYHELTRGNLRLR